MNFPDNAISDAINSDPDLGLLLREVRSRLDSDAAHDLGHLMRVATWTMRLAGDAASARVCIAAALLHDVVNVPKTHPDRARASEMSAAVARDILPRLGYTSADIASIADAIRDHSFSRGAVPESPLGRALQDADRLEALGAIGTFRCIATGARVGAEFFHAADPWALRRPLDDARYSIDHYFTKLLTLPATFNTAAGRTEAERRAAVMRGLLESLALEIGQPLTRALQ
ncbi:MAG: HD domain-containing protein [bacterium]